MSKDWLIYTSCGVTFKERAPTAMAALTKSPARRKDFEVVAIIQATAVVVPSPSMPITVMIVGNKAAMKPAPEEYRQ